MNLSQAGSYIEELNLDAIKAHDLPASA